MNRNFYFLEKDSHKNEQINLNAENKVNSYSKENDLNMKNILSNTETCKI